MTEHDFKFGARVLCRNFGRQLPDGDTLGVWWEKLRDMDGKIYARAVKALTDSEQRFPDNVPQTVRRYAIAITREEQEEEDRRERERMYRQQPETDQEYGKRMIREIIAKLSGGMDMEKVLKKDGTPETDPVRISALRRIREYRKQEEK